MTNDRISKAPLQFLGRVLVWDAPLRVCYALMAVCFAGAYLTAEQEEWRKVHATLEFTLGGLAVFRIIWGFVGTRHSRFSSFLRGSEAIMNNLRQLPYGWGKRHIGHSPIGALFIVGLLTLMLIASSSSCASSVLPTADWLDGIHAVATNMLLMVAGSYIAAVAFDSCAQARILCSR